MVDARITLFGDRRFGVQGHACSGCVQHAKVIGPIPNGDDIGGGDPYPRSNFIQRLNLRRLAKDRAAHIAGQPSILNQKCICAIFVKPQFS